MARVRGVIAASTAAGSILNVPGSMSTNTGVPPALWIVPAVAKNVKGVVMTSSPGLSPSALSGRRSASVPLAHAMPCFAPASRATALSSCGTGGPITNCWDSMTACRAGSTSSLIARYCATRSSNGTFTVEESERAGRTSPDPAGLGDGAEGAVRLFICRAASGARGGPVHHHETLTALAHPADAAGRHAHHERIRRHVRGHDRTRADEGVLAERHAADDRRIRTDRHATLHECGAILMLARHVAPWVHHVGKHTRRPAEHIVLQRHALVNRD